MLQWLNANAPESPSYAPKLHVHARACPPTYLILRKHLPSLAPTPTPLPGTLAASSGKCRRSGPWSSWPAFHLPHPGWGSWCAACAASCAWSCQTLGRACLRLHVLRSPACGCPHLHASALRTRVCAHGCAQVCACAPMHMCPHLRTSVLMLSHTCLHARTALSQAHQHAVQQTAPGQFIVRIAMRAQHWLALTHRLAPVEAHMCATSASAAAPPVWTKEQALRNPKSCSSMQTGQPGLTTAPAQLRRQWHSALCNTQKTSHLSSFLQCMHAPAHS